MWGSKTGWVWILHVWNDVMLPITTILCDTHRQKCNITPATSSNPNLQWHCHSSPQHSNSRTWQKNKDLWDQKKNVNKALIEIAKVALNVAHQWLLTKLFTGTPQHTFVKFFDQLFTKWGQASPDAPVKQSTTRHIPVQVTIPLGQHCNANN